MKKVRLMYLAGFLLVVLIEVLIALFIHDQFIRPYVGDILVVIAIYFFARIFIPQGAKWLPLYVFLFAAAVEVSQYFQLADRLGFGDNVFLRTLMGTVFDVKDIICYGIGCILIALGITIKKKWSIR